MGAIPNNSAPTGTAPRSFTQRMWERFSPVTAEPPKAPAIDDRTELTNWCNELITSLNTDLDRNYLRIKHLDLILPGSRDAQFDEAFKVATILAKADKIQSFLLVPSLSDPQINSFKQIYDTIKSEYNQMIEDKSGSTNIKASPKEISVFTYEKYKTLPLYALSWDIEQAREIIQRNIEQSLEQISVTYVANNDEKYKKHCEMVAYNILLKKLLNNESGPYFTRYLDQKDGKNSSEYLDTARRYHRIKACKEVQTVHKEVTSEEVLKRIRQDIKCLYMACMLTYE